MGDLFKLDKKDLSQLDPGGVLKSSHDDLSQSIRTVSGVTEVPSSYSRVNVTYNASGSVTRAVFYEGTQAEVTECLCDADIAGNLNNKYFLLYSENNESTYHVWYNVSAGGTDPAPSGSIGIEIPIETNDASEIVAMATELSLRHISDFVVQRIKNRLIIENSRKGAANSSVDFNTGFVLTTIENGSERLLKVIDIPYDGTVRYLFNTQEKKFEVESVTGINVEIDAGDGDNIAISAHEFPRNLVFTATKTKAQLSTSAYTNILTHTATEDLQIRTVRVKADTFGAFKLIINGAVRDYFQTSPFERNCRFEFVEEEGVTTSQDVEIEFLPDRLQIASYDFFMRIEAYKV
jgi:hypothetical protein